MYHIKIIIGDHRIEKLAFKYKIYYYTCMIALIRYISLIFFLANISNSPI